MRYFNLWFNEKTGVGFCNVLSKECLKKGIKIGSLVTHVTRPVAMASELLVHTHSHTQIITDTNKIVKKNRYSDGVFELPLCLLLHNFSVEYV